MRLMFFYVLLICFSIESYAIERDEKIHPFILLSLHLDSDFQWEDKFTSEKILARSWGKWLAKTINREESSVVICDSTCDDLIQNSSYLVKIYLNLKKKFSDYETKYVWEGRVALYQKLGTDPLIITPISKNQRIILNSKKSQEKQDILNLIFKSALSSLFYLKTHFEKKVVSIIKSHIKIVGFKNLQDALGLQKLIEQRGQPLNLKLNLSSFNGTEAIFDCHLNGIEKDLSEIISQVTRLKTFKNYNLINLSQESSYTIKMI